MSHRDWLKLAAGQLSLAECIQTGKTLVECDDPAESDYAWLNDCVSGTGSLARLHFPNHE